MPTRKVKAVIVLGILLVLLFASSILLANMLIQKPYVRNLLVKGISEFSGMDIKAEQYELNLWKGFGIYVNGFEAISRQGMGSINASEVMVAYDFSSLIRGNPIPTKIHFSNPIIQVPYDEDAFYKVGKGAIPVSFILVQWASQLETLSAENAQVNFIDKPISLKELFFRISCEETDETKMLVSSRGILNYHEKESDFNIQGYLLYKAREYAGMDFNLKTKRSSLNLFAWPDAIPVRGGYFAADLKIKGDFKTPFSVSGKANVSNADFSVLSGDDVKNYHLPQGVFTFEAYLDQDRIKAPSIALKLQDLDLRMSLDLDLKDKENPYMDMEIKSDPMDIRTCEKYFPLSIVPTWIGERLFPLFINGDTILESLTLKGSADEIAHLSIHENSDALRFVFDCKNFEIGSEDINRPIDNVFAKVILGSGSLKVDKFKGRFGGSEVLGGFLNVKQIYTDEPVYEVSVNGAFDMNDLLVQAESRLVPADFRMPLYKFKDIRGRMECDTEFIYRGDWKIPRIVKGEFSFKECSIDDPENLLPLLVNEGTIRLDETNQGVFKGTGFWGNSPFELNGGFDSSGESFIIKNGDISADLDMNQILSLFPCENDLLFVFQDHLPTTLNFSGTEDRWTGNGRLELGGVVLETESFAVSPKGENNFLSFHLDHYPGKKTVVNRVALSIKKSVLTLSGIIDPEEADSTVFDLSAPRFSLEDLGITYKGEEHELKGTLKGDLTIEYGAKSSLSESGISGESSGPAVNGRINGDDLSFDLKKFPSPVHSCCFQVDFRDKHISIPLLKLNMGDSLFHIRGDLVGWQGLQGSISMDSDFINIEDLWSFNKESGAGPDENKVSGHKDSNNDSMFSRFLDQSQVKLELISLKGKWRNLDWGPLKTVVQLKGRDIIIDDADIHFENGRMTLNGRILKNNDVPMMFNTHIRLTKQPIEELLSSVGVNSLVMTGTVNTEAMLHLRGSGSKELLSGMAGFGEINVEEGAIINSNVLIKVLDFLSLQKIYKKIPKGLPKDGFYFESIKGTGLIEKGVFKTEDFVMKSPVINAAAIGETDLANRTYNTSLIIQPLETLDSLVGNIPIIGYIIVGEDNKFLTYYFQVKGPWKKPEVNYHPFKDAGKGVLDTVKRIFMTPIRLLKKIPLPTPEEPIEIPDSDEEDKEGQN